MQTIILNITGMTCGACRNHVAQALQNTAGVQVASVNLKEGSALVQGQNIDLDQLIAAVEEEGYGAQASH